jgi:hypothetical protein
VYRSPMIPWSSIGRYPMRFPTGADSTAYIVPSRIANGKER